MATERKPWQEVVGKLAGMVALIAAITPPAIFFSLMYHHEKEVTQFEAAFIAESVNHIIRKEPLYWLFQQYHLDSLVSNRRSNFLEEQVVIRSNKLGIISESKVPLAAPTITQAAPLLDSGKLVGVIEVARSIRPMVLKATLVAFFSFLFGIVVYYLVRTFPLRSLQQVFSSLNDEKELAQVTLNSIGDAVIRVDKAMRVELLNPVAERILGWKQNEAAGLPIDRIFNIIDERSLTVIDNPINNCFAKNHIVTLTEHAILIRNDGHQFHIEMSVAPVPTQQGDCEKVVVVIRDVSERHMTLKQLDYMSQYDGLTDLPNRVLHQRRLSQALALSRRNRQMVGLFFIDLDRFKTVNDSMGHSTGDQLLTAVAQRLILCIRTENTVSRMGGDEFAVILEGLHVAEGAATVAQKILEKLSHPFFIDGQPLFISASIGIAIYESEDTPELMLQNAEIAMYRAKENGGNNYQFFEAEMNQAIAERMELETALRQALQNQEFLLHYQPKVDLATDKIVGVEALLRWQRPKIGICPPSKFIPVLEETNMIIEVGDWVISEACRQAQEWLSKGFPMKVAVNLSAKQLETAHFDHKVKEILAEHNLPGQFLEFEITESVFLSPLEHTEFTLNSLESMGITFSIDDFGTGYSSLGYLRRFPIESLKIDKSFIDNLTITHDSRTLAKAIIALAHSLSMKVIAEGVETEAQREILSQMNCNEIQGYLISKPVDVDRLLTLLKSNL